MSGEHRKSAPNKSAPKMKPVPANRTTLVAALDIGTSKVACMIARLKPCAPTDALRSPDSGVFSRGTASLVNEL